jgi:hypothetical protein
MWCKGEKMTIATPEIHKKSGISYAVTDDGLELPVIDVTHPAFAIQISEGELDRLMQEHMRTVERRDKAPAFVQKIMLRFMMRRSRLMRALSGAAGTFLGGVDTYILKLGPQNMGTGYASDIDRQIAASLPGLSVRLRLQNVSYLLADGLQPILSAAPGQPLHLLNIGGGPAIDSLNVLIIVHAQHPDLLAGRLIFIHILDLDESGPSFGRRALQALQAAGAPLHDIEITFEHIAYNWSDTTAMQELLHSLEPGTIVAASSEGALFEYGSDEEVTANLRVLHDVTPPAALVVGSVTRADTKGRLMNSGSGAALQLRGIDAFLDLARSAGWTLRERRDRPSGHDVCLQKAGK